jgi:hypothetical protein
MVMLSPKASEERGAEPIKESRLSPSVLSLCNWMVPVASYRRVLKIQTKAPASRAAATDTRIKENLRRNMRSKSRMVSCLAEKLALSRKVMSLVDSIKPLDNLVI